MATVTILKENFFEVVISVIGNTQETNTKIVDASTLNNALTGLTFHHLIVKEIGWSTPSGTITLLWEGSPNQPFLYLSGSGYLELSDRINAKIRNTATNPSGDILMSTSAAFPYTLILILEKAFGSYDKSEKYNY